ncbi:hypothetical protein AV540_25285 [Brevibacillus parabrevis]|uniref:hypothetical protein n=1 Tax=Brevibacillus parabrevis TaxID=54914 RepID=UPI0007ABD5E0|nr:hypothetical protein [Brevibacillus parabrevis]KZE43340.1 hypothetical protein AV540_25285 [Brevibacillus parabrevis]
MCRAVPEVQRVRDGITAAIDSIRDLEEVITKQSPHQTVSHLQGILEHLQHIQDLLAVEETGSRDRVTIQKFT